MTTYLTQEGYKKFQEELHDLIYRRRDEVAAILRETVSNGEDENPEYEMARSEQAFIEGRIRELEMLLSSAKIIEESAMPSNIVHVGSKVTLQEEGYDPETYLIVGSAEANPTEGRISNESPIGKAIISHSAGDEVVVHTPTGNFSVKIIEVE